MTAKTPPTPCEWQLAMLNVSILGAGGELVDKPKRCAELIEERYRSVHEKLVTAKRQLADMQPRVDALVAALRDCAAGLDEIAAYLRRTGDNPELALARANQARAALKLAGKE